MARAAAYGGIQPDVFLDLEFEDGIELARRVTKLHDDEAEMGRQVQVELAKTMIKQIGELGRLIARKPSL